MEHKQLFFCLLAGALSVYSGFNLTHSSLNFGTLALYLLTPEASFIIGQNIAIDGGRTLGCKGD